MCSMRFLTEVLSKSFPEQWGHHWSRPLYSVDIKRLNYLLWGLWKNWVYENNIHTIKQEQQEIVETVICITEDTLAAAKQNSYSKLEMVLGIQMVHILKIVMWLTTTNSDTRNTVIFATQSCNYMYLKPEYLLQNISMFDK